jgi:hypothetical protein
MATDGQSAVNPRKGKTTSASDVSFQMWQGCDRYLFQVSVALRRSFETYQEQSPWNFSLESGKGLCSYNFDGQKFVRFIWQTHY